MDEEKKDEETKEEPEKKDEEKEDVSHETEDKKEDNGQPERSETEKEVADKVNNEGLESKVDKLTEMVSTLIDIVKNSQPSFSDDDAYDSADDDTSLDVDSEKEKEAFENLLD